MALWLTAKFLVLTTSAISLPLLTGLGMNQFVKKDKEKNKKISSDNSKEALIEELRKEECQQQRNRQRSDKNFWGYWKSGASHYLRQSYEECMIYSNKNKLEKTNSKEEIINELRKQECERQQSLQQSDKNFWSHWGNFASHYIKQSYGECMSYKDKNSLVI